MSLFDKVCLRIGKIVVYCVAGLSCLYIVDAGGSWVRPYIVKVLVWCSDNRFVLCFGATLGVVICIILSYLFSRLKYRRDLYKAIPELKTRTHRKS